MPIITLQRRLRQAGRIRIGAKVATKSGGMRPDKLENFRFTSPDKPAIEAVAEVYGGDVQPWDGAAVGQQWEVYAKSTSLDVFVPPTDIAFSQFFEDWSGGVCRKRCDGETNVLTDSPCTCDPGKPDCKPTSRLNVILTALDGVGVWRLETHGWNSAAELSGSIEVLKVMQSRGAMVPGRLLLEQRQSKSLGDDGKVQTFNFAVPILDFRVNVAALATGAPQRPALPVTPIQADVPALPSVAEQLQAVQGTPEPRARRSNSAAPMPSTGLRPRGMDTTIEASATRQTKVPEDDRTPGGASKASVRKLMATVRGSKDVPDDDDGRKEWAALGVNHPVTSFNDLTQKEVSHLIDVASGKLPLIPDVPTAYPPGEEPF